MAEFTVEFELQGLKLRIKGTRDDVPVAVQQLGRQVAGMLQPAAAVVDGEVIDDQPAAPPQPLAPAAPQTPKKKRRKRNTPVSGAANGASAASSQVVTWKHDSSKWGDPRQEWKAWQKALWLLHVAAHETEHQDLTATEIVHSFNAQFRSAGTIRPADVARELKRKHGPLHAYVDSVPATDPERWFLVDAGKTYAQQLVAEARGEPSTAGA